MFWSGDLIIWKNFLKHYLLCLEHVCSSFIIGGENYPIDVSHIPVFNTPKNFPTPHYHALYKEICDLFFGQEFITTYLHSLASRTNPVRRNELIFHLRHMHLNALDTIFTVYEKNNLMPMRANDNPLRRQEEKRKIEYIDSIDSFNLDLKYPDIEDVTERLYASVISGMSQVDLIGRYNDVESSPNKRLVIIDFPDKYVKQLDRVVYVDWYTACFLEKCNSPALWGYYGDNHKGVCLKFKTSLSHGKPAIKLHGLNGFGGNNEKTRLLYGDVNFQFYKVNYAARYPEVDFFKSLGYLSMSALNECWYCDEHGNKSSCADDIIASETQWREKYWNNFIKAITTKLEHWSSEEEYRLILSPSITDYSADDRRRFKFNFNDLEGIIFGINTPEHDKMLIMRIIEAKCRAAGRRDFKFYQAYYAKYTGEIGALEMSLLKFE